MQWQNYCIKPIFCVGVDSFIDLISYSITTHINISGSSGHRQQPGGCNNSSPTDHNSYNHSTSGINPGYEAWYPETNNDFLASISCCIWHFQLL